MWVKYLVQKNKKINLRPKEAWDNIKILKNGFTTHHVKDKVLKFRQEDGSINTADKDNMRIAGKYFKKVLSRDEVDWNHLNKTEENRKMFEIADPIDFSEFEHPLNKLKWHKSPGLNGMSLSISKSLDKENKHMLLTFIREQKD